MSTSPEHPVDLHKNAFFLHSFLDEYIGKGKGNDIRDAITAFETHLPEPYLKQFKSARDPFLKIFNIIEEKIMNCGAYREMNKNPPIPDDYFTSGSLKYVENVYAEVKQKKFSDEFAREYEKSEYYIDTETEQLLDNMINKIIDEAINMSDNSPVFFPIGHRNHLLGLMITNEYVVITNSGDGIEHHNKSGDDTQCVLYFNRPSYNILKKLLKEFIQIAYIYDNIDINSVYSIIYKLYFMHIIKDNNYINHVVKLIDDISSELTNGIMYHPTMAQQNNSKILKAVWVNPKYHEEAVYTLYVDYEGIQNILSEMFTKYILDKFFENNNKVKITDILSQIKNKIIGELDNTHRNERLKELFIKINYPVNEKDKIIIDAMKKYIKLPENNNDMSYTFEFEKVLTDKLNTVLIQNNGFNIFSHYVLDEKEDNRKTEVNLELFCDLLLHESIVSNNSIVIKKNHTVFLKRQYLTIYTEGSTPLQLLLKKLKDDSPHSSDLFSKLREQKIVAYFPYNFYVREQYAGSCSFNGILLAVSLLGSDKYVTNYDSLKSAIRDSQIKNITNELNSGGLKLTDKDSLVVDALENAMMGINKTSKAHKRIMAPKNDASKKSNEDFIKLLKSKLPPRDVSFMVGKVIEPQTSESESKSYILLDNAKLSYSNLDESWSQVLLMGSKYYNEQSFTKYVMNPTILWITNNSKKILAPGNGLINKKKDALKQMVLKLLNKIVSIVIDIATKKNITINMLALFIIAVYAVFKSIQINELFNEETVTIISDLYKKTRQSEEEKQFFDNFYLTTSIAEDAIIDLCTIIGRYQFLILSQNRIAEFAHIAIITSKKNIPNNAKNIPNNAKNITHIDRYKKLLDTNEMKNLNSIMHKCDIFEKKMFKINKVIAINNISNVELNKNISDNIIYGNKIYANKIIGHDFHIKIKYDKNKPHFYMTFNQESNTNIFLATINTNNDGHVIVYPYKGYILLRIDDMIDKMTLANTEYITLDVMFSSHVYNIATYMLNIENSLYLNSYTKKDVNDFEICTYTTGKRKNNLEYRYNIIDMLKVNHYLNNGEFTLLTDYLNSFLYGNPPKYEFYLPLYQISPENISDLPIIKGNKMYYNNESNYLFFNSHKIMKFYDDEINKIHKITKNIKLPNNIENLIDALEVLRGNRITNSVKSSGVEPSEKATVLELFWNSIKDKKCIFTSNYTDPLSQLDNKFVFFFDNDPKKKIIYDNNKKQIFINEYQMRIQKELEDVIKILKKTKSKNAQMIKNMIYYAEGIPEFAIGLNSDFTAGIIAFMPKDSDYYEKYFYDHPWVEMDKINDTNESSKRYDKLKEMSLHVKNFTWVRFDVDGFNSVIPLMGSDIVSENDNYLLTFTLFCEHLLLQGKYKLFGLLIPQLVSAYFTVIEISSNDENVILNKHKKLIEYIIDDNNKYVISPYRYYYLNKLTKLIRGESKYNHDYMKREKYYPYAFQKIDNQSRLEIKTPTTEPMKHYIQWIKQWNTHKIEEINSKIRINKENLLGSVIQILGKISTEVFDIDNVRKIIEKYPNMIEYICTQYNWLITHLQLTILNKVKEILEDKNIKDEELEGNLKHYTKETFDHSLKVKDSKHFEESKYIILFELITGKILTKNQYDVIMSMLDDEKSKIYKVYELLMGRGKTAVIIPCIMFCCMMSKNIATYSNIINCLPMHLVNQSINILNKLTPFLVNGFVARIMCARKSEMNKLVSSLIDLNVRKIMCIDDTSLKSYLLSNAEDKFRNDMSSPLRPLCDNTLILLDEFDTMADPLKSDLNYPYGDRKNLEQQNILNKLVVCITEKIFDNKLEYMMYSDRADKGINKLIIKNAMIEIKDNIMHNIQDSLKSKSAPIKELPNEITILCNEIKKYYDSLMNEYASQTGGSMKSLLAFIIKNVYQSYIMCLGMMLDKDYGWDESAENNQFIVIPYSAQNTPIKGSKYSDPIINIILTSIAYFSKSFRDVDSVKLIEYIKSLKKPTSKKNIIKEKNLDDKGVNYALMTDAGGLTNHLHILKTGTTEQKKIYKNYLRMYLEEVILVDIKVDPDIYNCSFIDVIDPNFIKNKFALSGTVKVHLPNFDYEDGKYELSGVEDDGITKNTIKTVLYKNNAGQSYKTTLRLEDLNVLVVTEHKNNTDIGKIVNKLDANTRTMLYSIIKLLGNDADENKNYNVLIDVGSFLRNFTNYEFALIISDYYTDHHVVYFDLNDQPIAMHNKKIDNKFSMKSLKHDRKTKVIFDQKHTVGTDIDLHSLSHAILTVGKTTSRTALVQGAFRLREADLNQKITYLSKDMEKESDPVIMTNNLIENIDAVEERIFDSSKIKFHKQYILCLLRKLQEYSEDSYKFKPFIPCTKLTDEIFKIPDKDYKKDKFTKYVNRCLKGKCIEDTKPEDTDHEDTEPEKSESEEPKTDLHRKIEIKLAELNKYEQQDNSIDTQKQTNTQKTTQIETAIRQYAQLIPMLNLTDTFYYRDELYPFTSNQIILFEKQISKTPMMVYTNTLKIRMSPDAARAIMNVYKNGICNDLFYMALSESSDQCMLYTSLDKLILFTQNNELNKKLIEINEFVEGDTKKCIFQNFMMMLLLKIPSTDKLQIITNIMRDRSMAEIIGIHYKSVFKYDVRKISKGFAEILEI